MNPIQYSVLKLSASVPIKQVQTSSADSAMKIDV